MTMRIIIGLSIALLLSLGANVLQLRHTWITAGEAKGEAERVALASENTSLKQANAVEKAIADLALDQNAHIFSELDAIAAKAQEVRTVYRSARAAAPLAIECAPGEGRVDAVNQALGPQK